MMPAQLTAESFAGYSPEARSFAVAHLALLRRLPLVLCPSFLRQIENFGTSFPAERASLTRQCEALGRMPGDGLAALIAPFDSIALSEQLAGADWIHAPASFIANLTAYLWSSGQINAFRAATQALFEAIPPDPEQPHRLTLVVLGQGASLPATPVLARLRKRGVAFSHLDAQAMPGQILAAFRQHAAASSEPYAHWYVDGAEPWAMERAQAHVVGYTALEPLRKRVLSRVDRTLASGDAGAEQMRARLTETTAAEIGARELTADPVLQRFYTELFTESSGPQLFSTSFVQWTGRELARRARPHTLLLRYTPRQRQRSFNTLVEQPADELDPEGSLRDAEMGAYYNWVEMQRITAEGRGTFVAWIEGTGQGVLLGANAPAGTLCETHCSLAQAMAQFG